MLEILSPSFIVKNFHVSFYTYVGTYMATWIWNSKNKLRKASQSIFDAFKVLTFRVSGFMSESIKVLEKRDFIRDRWKIGYICTIGRSVDAIEILEVARSMLSGPERKSIKKICTLVSKTRQATRGVLTHVRRIGSRGHFFKQWSWGVGSSKPDLNYIYR
jgi:hypothetical protein